MTLTAPRCPICTGQLRALGEPCEVDRLLDLWRPVTFSKEVREEHLRQAASTQLHRCPNCRLGIFLPQVIGTPSFYVEAYNLEGTQSDSSFTYSVDKWDFQEGLRDIRPGARVLEVGCGPGNFLTMLKQRNCDAVGVESNELAAAAARRQGHTIFPSIQPLLESGEAFERIFAFHVIEHVPNPVAFLGDLRRLLGPGGRIGIAVPNQDGPLRLIEPCVQDMPPHHATRWSRKTFRHLADKSGMDLQRMVSEPLTRDNAYYYFEYLPPRLLRGGSWLAGTLRRWTRTVLRGLLMGYLGCLRAMGLSSSRILPGQAIYVLLANPAGQS